MARLLPHALSTADHIRKAANTAFNSCEKGHRCTESYYDFQNFCLAGKRLRSQDNIQAATKNKDIKTMENLVIAIL